MTLYLLSYMLGCVGSIKDSEDAEWTIVVLGSWSSAASRGQDVARRRRVYFSLLPQECHRSGRVGRLQGGSDLCDQELGPLSFEAADQHQRLDGLLPQARRALLQALIADPNVELQDAEEQADGLVQAPGRVFCGLESEVKATLVNAGPTAVNYSVAKATEDSGGAASIDGTSHAPTSTSRSPSIHPWDECPLAAPSR